MRLSGPFFGFAALALLFALASGPSGRPLHLSGPQRQAKEPLVLVADRQGRARIARTDLELNPGPVRAQSKDLGYVDAWAFSPGGLLAVASHPNENGYVRDAIRFANLSSLRLVRGSVPIGGGASTLLWASSNRIVAVVYDCCSDSSTIAVVDPAKRRVISRIHLDESVASVSRAPDTLVLLLTPQNDIGPARLAVVGPTGEIRSVKLDRVTAGRKPRDGNSNPIGTIRIPAVAVDPDGYRAFVIQPDGPAADVSLRTLDVSYHDLVSKSLLARLSSWLQPSAQAKGLNGPERHGLWLGDGLLAVTGTDEHATLDDQKGEIMTTTPGGAVIVDTHDWTVRTLDRGADELAATDGLLLATGRTSTSTSERSTGMGLAAYGPDLEARFRLFGGSSAWVQATWNGRSYVQVGELTEVVELATGRVVAERDGRVPTLLLRDGP